MNRAAYLWDHLTTPVTVVTFGFDTYEFRQIRGNEYLVRVGDAVLHSNASELSDIIRESEEYYAAYYAESDRNARQLARLNAEIDAFLGF